MADLLYVLFDNGGLDSLAEHNISAPVIDLSSRKGESLVTAIGDLEPTLVEAVKGGIKTICFDTFSTYDGELEAHFRKLYPEEKDSQRMWGLVFGSHIRLIDACRPLKATIIFNCHATMKREGFGIDGKNQTDLARKAAGLPTEGGLIVPEISGKAFRTYHGICSLVLPLSKRRDPKTGATSRCVFPRGYRGFTGLNRFNSLLDEVEPADYKALFTKIRDRVSNLDVAAEPNALTERNHV